MKIPKGRNPARKLMKGSKIMVPTITKTQGRYKYHQKLIRHINDCRKRREKNNRKRFEEIIDVNTFEQAELLQQQQVCQERKSKDIMLYPFLICNALIPECLIPQYLEVAIHKGTRVDYSNDVLYYRVSAKELIQKILIHKSKKQKLNFSVPQMELGKQEYTIPRIVEKFLRTIHRVNLWLYCGNRQTQWHYDGHDNFLYVLGGKKIVYLARPQDIKSNNSFSLFSNHAKGKVQEKSLKVKKAVVKKGGCLFIPKGWWHKVFSFGEPNFALNFWGNSVSDILEALTPTQKSLTLKSLLFELTDNYCSKRIPSWEHLREEQMAEFREMSGQKLVNEVEWEWKGQKIVGRDE